VWNIYPKDPPGTKGSPQTHRKVKANETAATLSSEMWEGRCGVH